MREYSSITPKSGAAPRGRARLNANGLSNLLCRSGDIAELAHTAFMTPMPTVVVYAGGDFGDAPEVVRRCPSGVLHYRLGRGVMRYEQVDPFILVHEGRIRLSDMKGVDTRHPHRGFDNLWYILEGSVSTGHSTGPGGAMERARLTEGALLALRTGRGAWHAEAIGADELEEGQADTEFRGVLFWVNLARKDKQAEPSAQVVQPEQIPARQEGDATVRVLVDEGSPVRLGTPALVLDIELPE